MHKPIFTTTAEDQVDNYGKVIIEPLESGFGNTLGNALRRVLLSNLKGASITKIKVNGLNHKFSTFEGMSEDTIDLILNLKKVKVAYDGEEPVTATLSVKGPGKVTAKDIKAPATVKIVDPSAVIASLAKGAKLDMEIEIAAGYGYSPAEDRVSDVIGEIPIDALYSPVEKVAFKVESTRVGRRTDFDKLIMEVFTDGSQLPEDVVNVAAQILTDYFNQIVNPAEIEEEDDANAQSEDEPKEYELSVEELGLPTRIANALRNGEFNTVRDLASSSLADLKQVKNLGAKSLDAVRDALKAKGVELE